MVKSGAGAVAALLQCGVEVRTRGADGREESKEDAGEERDAESEGEYPPIDRDCAAMLADARNIPGAHRQQPAQANVAEHQAQYAAGDRKQHALGKQLQDNALASRSHGRPYGELALAPGSVHQEQIGNVRAGNQEHQAHRA